MAEGRMLTEVEGRTWLPGVRVRDPATGYCWRMQADGAFEREAPTPKKKSVDRIIALSHAIRAGEDMTDQTTASVVHWQRLATSVWAHKQRRKVQASNGLTEMRDHRWLLQAASPEGHADDDILVALCTLPANAYRRELTEVQATSIWAENVCTKCWDISRVLGLPATSELLEKGK